MIPTPAQADEMLETAGRLNPGLWTGHSRTTGRAARVIAAQCGLDPVRAYVSGALHDIGRYEGVRGLHHIYEGYQYMLSKNAPEIARICITHSFPIQKLEAYSGGNWDCTPAEINHIRQLLMETQYDDYDLLIQLCDAISLPQGVCLMEKRLFDVASRYGFNDLTVEKWKATIQLKEYFDKRCCMNIYDLFYDEIRNVTFMPL